MTRRGKWGEVNKKAPTAKSQYHGWHNTNFLIAEELLIMSYIHEF
jgi:hypothetical protein